MKGLQKAYVILIKVLVGIAAGILTAMMFLITIDVVLRYIFNSPITGSFEIVEFMMAILVSFSMVYCAYKNSHVSVDIVFDLLPARPRSLVAKVGSLITLVFIFLIAWQNILYVVETFGQRLTSSILYIPTYPFVIAVALGFWSLFLATLIEFIGLFTGVGEK